MNRAIFLFLSLLSGAVELGGILYAIELGLGLFAIIGIGLAYQLGNLVPNPIRINRALTLLSAAGAAVLLGLAHYQPDTYAYLFAGYALMAVAIQSLRSIQKENVGTTIKRSFRILGFLAAPFTGAAVSAGAALLLAVIAAAVPWTFERAKLIRPKVRFLSWVMIIHQIHYFSYAYFVIILLWQAVPSGSSIWVGIFFVLGWITYTGISHFLRAERYFRYFLGGHLFLSLVLLLMAWQIDNGPLVVALWIATGLGGGTVFCITKINSRYQELSKQDVVFSENIGHVLGVVLGMLLYLATQTISSTVYLAGGSAALAMLLMAAYKRTMNKVETV
ncbi:hypothetical protein HGI30_20010 [Paenibacillus albicereus]|uniref:MFS transporter n=1 Tax=Paenibacillus albicereus TaxID=2726185 RepID=A0A6H2H1Q8_9BACL|nr:hypothetical protein [Paenibacillus albicereus]QJC53592.1 hypothetical protein HGI30_20010 [Paenibacillus albicereus]